MPMAIRDIRRSDLDAVLALNNASGPDILPMTADDLACFFARADYFRVAEVDGKLAGFLIALREGCDCAGDNYRWFNTHHDAFLYIDRIVLAPDQRGLGLGRALYSDVESFAEVRAPLLTCEVFLEPPNDIAMLFHGTFGFNEVGQQTMQPSGIRVSLLAKELPSFQYVKQRYLDQDGLPDQAWLRARQLPPAASAEGTK